MWAIPTINMEQFTCDERGLISYAEPFLVPGFRHLSVLVSASFMVFLFCTVYLSFCCRWRDLLTNVQPVVDGYIYILAYTI